MRLQFSGAPEVSAPRAYVWECLMDPQFVARAAPGVESVETLDPTHFKVISGFGVGAIKVRFALDVELSDVVPPERATMDARGKAPGSNVDVSSRIAVEELDGKRTRLTWSAETDVSGTVASVGARLMEGTAKKLTEQFWTEFAARVSRRER
jgi:uncharacterized protein